jgi:hypothetical protein
MRLSVSTRTYLAYFAASILAVLLGWIVTLAEVNAQQPADARMLPSVTVTAKENLDPVEKSYRRIVRGIDLFEAQRALAPAAPLRFKVLARKRDTDMQQIEMYVMGSSVEFPVLIASDNTFALERNPRALDEDAQVVPNRKARSMTWRTDIRTPGLPPNVRRLGDLRLECRVGMEAGLISESVNLVARIAGALVRPFVNTPAYCDKLDPQYLFFADRPIFGVTLVDGARREVVPISRLYGGAIEEGDDEDRSGCDCELLVDRTYYLPLGDRSWPDDTRVEFEYMDDPA